MKFVLLFSIFLLGGCVDYNVTLYSSDGKTSTKCAIAVMQDEGGVCYHGHECSDGVDASQGCWLETVITP